MTATVARYLACALGVLCVIAPTVHAEVGRAWAFRNTRFNDGWKFLKSDAVGAEATEFDDHSWRDIQLPHDWSIEGPFDQKWASGTGYLPGGIGWYRKTFSLTSAQAGRRISIRFDGVYKNSKVWCNGQLLGERPNGYVSFEYDLTPYLRPMGQTNVIAVRVDHSDFADSRWYPGSGINRDVWLINTGDVHVPTNGTFVTTPQVDAHRAVVDVRTSVKNDGTEPAKVTLVSTIYDNGTVEVACASSDVTIAAGASADSQQSIAIDMPQLWSPDHPHLYLLRTQIVRGDETLDDYRTPFGVRAFAFDSQHGFTLNGQPMKLKGVCLHDDAGVLGAVVPASVWERRLAKLKDMGCNAIRTSHNPPPPALLDLCDRVGFLVMDEAFDEWTRGKKKWVHGMNQGEPSFDGYHEVFDRWADVDLRDMLLRDRNHPSIILWSIGNEIDYKNDPYPPNSPELPPIAERLIRVVKQFDKTRPVTAACASVPTNLFCDQLDVVGYNYQENLYADDHAKHPKRVIYGSENGHKLDAWQAVAENEFIAGQFLWTGIDYLGESHGWPARGSQAGLLDLAGFEKPQFYFRKSLWTEAPMVYLRPTAFGITCYTNCEAVELFEDGRSLGERPLPAERVITWPDRFNGALLKAVGKRAGKDVCTLELKRPGAPARLVARVDGGGGVAQVEIEVMDLGGTRVTDAKNRITCAVDGPGRLLGIENGDLNDHELATSDSRQAHFGRAIVYIEPRGRATLRITSAGLEGTSVTVTPGSERTRDDPDAAAR